MFKDLKRVATIILTDYGIDSLLFSTKLHISPDPNSQAYLAFEKINDLLVTFKADKPAIGTSQIVEIILWDNPRGNMDCTFVFKPEMKTDEEFNNSISQSVLAVHAILKMLRNEGTTDRTKITKHDKDGKPTTTKIFNPNEN